jgi:hypothetical protein
MIPFALTRGVITDNRSASFPSSEVTHVLPATGGCESGFAIADDGDSVGEPQPPMTIVSNNSANAVLRFSIACFVERPRLSNPAREDVPWQPERGGMVSGLCIP